VVILLGSGTVFWEGHFDTSLDAASALDYDSSPMSTMGDFGSFTKVGNAGRGVG